MQWAHYNQEISACFTQIHPHAYYSCSIYIDTHFKTQALSWIIIYDINNYQLLVINYCQG